MRQKIFLLLLFFQVGMVDTFSQKVAIENLKQNIAYPYLDNPMNIIVEGIPCSEIFVSTNNGEMQSKENCEYVFFPRKVGIASIFIHKIEKGDTIEIEERKYRVKRWPRSKARIGRINSGKIGLAEFKIQRGIIVPVENFDIDANYKVISYRLQIVRGQDLIGEVFNTGGKFEEKARGLILKAESGDRIIVDEIMILTPGSKMKIELDEIDIVIK